MVEPIEPMTMGVELEIDAVGQKRACLVGRHEADQPLGLHRAPIEAYGVRDPAEKLLPLRRAVERNRRQLKRKQ